jgi:hypothetical protein
MKSLTVKYIDTPTESKESKIVHMGIENFNVLSNQNPAATPPMIIIAI